MIKVRIPTPLRSYVGNAREVSAEAGTVLQVLDTLTAQHPDLKKHLYNDEGKLRSFVNVYLGDEDVRYLQGTDTVVPEGATLSIVPSVAGGTTLSLWERRAESESRRNPALFAPSHLARSGHGWAKEAEAGQRVAGWRGRVGRAIGYVFGSGRRGAHGYC